MPVQQAGSVLGLRLAMAPEEEGPALRGRQLLRTQNGPLALPPFILIFLLILILLFLHLIISSPFSPRRWSAGLVWRAGLRRSVSEIRNLRHPLLFQVLSEGHARLPHARLRLEKPSAPQRVRADAFRTCMLRSCYVSSCLSSLRCICEAMSFILQQRFSNA